MINEIKKLAKVMFPAPTIDDVNRVCDQLHREMKVLVPNEYRFYLCVFGGATCAEHVFNKQHFAWNDDEPDELWGLTHEYRLGNLHYWRDDFGHLLSKGFLPVASTVYGALVMVSAHTSKIYYKTVSWDEEAHGKIVPVAADLSEWWKLAVV
jgi:hypothetical protein